MVKVRREHQKEREVVEKGRKHQREVQRELKERKRKRTQGER